MFGKYILKDGVPVLEPNIFKWAAWFETAGAERIIKKTTVYHGDAEVEVSTVFLALDHRFNPSEKAPILYETMVFGGPGNGEQWRYDSEKKARKGHTRAVKLQKMKLQKGKKHG